ncbi:MAG: AVAST type 2 anti-phage system protein Avs2 [Candidatus Kapabacteria bacterium]|nr:AVAST type 2 anti-phage system protein Avs2 [Candidatus Kapabacteria bacterium]
MTTINSIDFSKLMPYKGSQNLSFEQLCYQLSIIEFRQFGKFTKIDGSGGDGGVEFYLSCKNGEEWGWQCKFFGGTGRLDEGNRKNQIIKSLQSACKHYPSLTKYFICLKTNLTPKEKKWFNETLINNIPSEMNVVIEFWGEAELLAFINKPENAGIKNFFFGEIHLTREWFERQCNLSITNLGVRYTPDLNFELEISEIFEGLGRTEKFKNKITNIIDELIINWKKALINNDDLEGEISHLGNNLEKFINLFECSNFLGINNLDIESYKGLLKNTEEIVNEIQTWFLEEERKIQKEKNYNHYFKKYGNEINKFYEFNIGLSDCKALFNSPLINLSNNPYLVLDGEAGIGKSHLIADIISKRIKNNYESIFLLGQHFVTDEDPWTQIFKILHININPNNFLKLINEYGKLSDKRVVIFIDAINEGRGKYFWNSHIKSFINELKSYPWIGLVLTVRTSYKDLIFPKEEMKDFAIIQYPTYGFRNVEYEASKLFFNNYKIELPNVPLLHPEFQNPLFLRLFCEGIKNSGLNKIPDGLQGITSIISFFINGVNNILSNPQRLNYSKSLNLVKRAIDIIIQYIVENHVKYIPYETAYEIIDAQINTLIYPKGFIDELIVEGVLSKNNFRTKNHDNEEGIYLAYERFEDHLISIYLLEQFQNLDIEFKEDGHLYDYIKDEPTINRNSGLIEALSIQIPEKYSKELWEYIPIFHDNFTIVESFVKSLLWRKTETINKDCITYINDNVLAHSSTSNLFWETILNITSIPGHFFNAYFLHKHLMSFTLADRDAMWTQLLKYKFDDYSAVKRLIDWAWELSDKAHISDESVKLASITLAWFHTSTNRKLRDSSTKALINLLQDRINVLIELLITFENVNDPYVFERLFAVAYGCALRTKQTDLLVPLSEYIYKSIFKEKDEVYPHILLRDYARGVIEYSFNLNLNLSFDISGIRPPYKSNFPVNIPLIEELNMKYDNENYRELWSSIMGFGDFARYVIGTNNSYTDWTGYKLNETPIEREVFLDKFKDILSEVQLVLFDRMNTHILQLIDELGIENEEISFLKTIGRKSDEEIEQIRNEFKHTLNPENLCFYEKEIEPFLDNNLRIKDPKKNFDLKIVQRFILSRVIELGWKPELHHQYDKEIGTGRTRTTLPNERIGKKYQWIAYYEILARLTDNYFINERSKDGNYNIFQGPWEPYIRDIDPTIFIKRTGNNGIEESLNFWWYDKNIFNWNCSSEDWIHNSTDIPNLENIIQVTDKNNEDWIILEGFPIWEEPKKIGFEKWSIPQKEIWCQFRSYLVKEDDFNKFQKWISDKEFMGRWMPESRTMYEMFFREYFWSPAYKFFNSEYYQGIEWHEIIDEETEEYISSVIVTAENYLWEEEYDYSKEDSISFLIPSSTIFKGLGLKFSEKEGEFLDSSNKVICFATNVYFNSKPFLLIKKAPFIKYLQKNGLKIIWTVIGEKLIIGGMSINPDDSQRMEISGNYYLEQEKLNGEIKTKIT